MRHEKLFVSYASENTVFVKTHILPQIKRARREIWFAPRSIAGGDDWRVELLKGLQSCDRLLVVISKESQESQYVKLEVAFATKPLLEKHGKIDARRIQRAILPVVLEERGAYGESTVLAASGENGPPIQPQVDPYLLHPY